LGVRDDIYCPDIGVWRALALRAGKEIIMVKSIAYLNLLACVCILIFWVFRIKFFLYSGILLFVLVFGLFIMKMIMRRTLGVEKKEGVVEIPLRHVE
jgi:hypothetical protein